MRKSLLVVLAVLFVIGVSGCGKRDSETTSGARGSRVKVDRSSGKVTIKDDKGTAEISAGGTVKLPEGFPSDVYVYDGATVFVSAKHANALSVSLRTKDAAAKVLETYSAKMKAAGWKEETAVEMGGGGSRHYTKDKRTAMVIVGGDREQTTIGVHVETREE